MSIEKYSAARESKSLDVRALKIFEAVASSGSISIAASELQITQSAVSQAVTQIEQILGTAVLDRTRRPLRLTPAGITLSRHARQIVHDMDRLIAQVHEADLASRPEIRVGMIDSFAATAGPLIVKKITLSASQVLLWSGLAYSHAQALLNRQLDLIVTSDPMEDLDNLVRRALFSEPFMVVIPRSRLEQFEDADLKTMIHGMPLIRFSGRSHFGAIVERYRHGGRCDGDGGGRAWLCDHNAIVPSASQGLRKGRRRTSTKGTCAYTDYLSSLTGGRV
jgi:molybdate transport repressor ModE-like protein